jgi:signal transduction histidine kinase/ligand-binding sensor domain-containing protein/DNA-binding response OmpR family regulator
MKTGFLILVFVSLSSLPCVGQSYFFSSLRSTDGLPSNNINSIAQDKGDFIWIGTGNGLARFDGYRFQTFKREENPNSIPFNEISALLVDGDQLWVGTWRGLCKINTLTFEVTRIPLKGNSTVRCLYMDRDGIIWVGTASGLVRIDKKGEQKNYSREKNGLSHNTIRAIYQDKHKNLWVGTYDKLNKLPAGSDQFTTIDLKGTYKPELKNNLICDVKPSGEDDSSLWVGTETGFVLLNTNTLQFDVRRLSNSGLSNEVIKNIYTGEDGKLWLGTDFGLNIYDLKSNRNEAFFHNPQLDYSIANNIIWQIFEDNGGVIWIVTSNGLSRANKHNHIFRFNEVTYKIKEQNIGNQVKALLTSSEGILWIATIHGVQRIDPEKGTTRVFDIDSKPNERILLNNVFALAEDDLGRIWIGTAGGINVWDEKSQRMSSITASAGNGLSSNYIARFIHARDGSMWVAAWEGGLYKIVKGFETLEDIKFEYAGDFGTERVAYAMNAIWSINENGLFRIDPLSYSTKPVDSFNKAARGRDIFNLYASSKGVLWAGTLNGVLEYNPATDEATFHPMITGTETAFNNIISDQNENIWAGAHRCVVKFAPTEKRTEIFPLDKELPLNSFYNSCSTIRQNGEICFGGDNGFISFEPSIEPNPYAPFVVISSIAVNNKTISPLEIVNDRSLLQKDISQEKEVNLNYAERSVTFEFSSLHFWQPETNVYAYKLDGFDGDWNYVSGTKNFAVYSNLPAGTYTFRVRGTNNYGVWSDKEASLVLRIDPPLFLSTPFRILYITLVILLIAAALRVYSIRLKLKNDVRIAVLEKEHAEEIVSTKQNFFTSISHELRTPISLIIPPLQEIIKRGNLDDHDKALIGIAEKNSQRLLRLINQVLEYRKLEHENQSLTISLFDIVSFSHELYSLFSDKAARNNIDFTIHSALPSCEVWADKEKVEIIIFNLLSNAFKFTPKNGKVRIEISEEKSEAFPDGSVVISVVDNGIGIPEKDQAEIFKQFYQTEESRNLADGSGIGLTLVAEYLKMHRGKIKVVSSPGEGSTFTIALPLGSAHFPIDRAEKAKEIALVAKKNLQDEKTEDYEFNLRTEKPVIVLAEDNPDMIEFIVLTLEKKYHFVVCNNGEEGLNKALSIVPDIIITDIMMPVMDGLELCRRIKKENKTSHIPIILLTAKSLTAHKIEGIRVGADVYLTKPFEIEVLEAHIDHLLERKTELYQYFRHELVTEPTEKETGKENEDDRFLRKVMNSIEANISNPDFSVESLSDEMGMSSTHLYRKLKSLTQLGGNEIIKKYRIKKASLLLKNKEGNISEIMYEVGFSNLSYFSKCFRAEFGVTPKEYQLRESKHSFDVRKKLDRESS